MWDTLASLLSDLLDMYRRLAQTGREKKDILISGDTAALEEMTKREELLLLQVGKIERKREQLVMELAAASGLGDGQASLTALAHVAPGEMAGKIAELVRDFSEVTAELVSVNQINTQLIQQALHYVNFNINVLTQVQTGPTYGAGGKAGENQSPLTILDTKA